MAAKTRCSCSVVITQYPCLCCSDRRLFSSKFVLVARFPFTAAPRPPRPVAVVGASRFRKGGQGRLAPCARDSPQKRPAGRWFPREFDDKPLFPPVRQRWGTGLSAGLPAAQRRSAAPLCMCYNV